MSKELNREVDKLRMRLNSLLRTVGFSLNAEKNYINIVD